MARLEDRGRNPRYDEDDEEKRRYKPKPIPGTSTGTLSDAIRRATDPSYETRKTQHPALQTSSEKANLERRLEHRGVSTAPAPKSWWENTLDAIDRPRRFGVGVVEHLSKGGKASGAWDAGTKAFNSDYEDVPTGVDQLKRLSKTDTFVLGGAARLLRKTNAGEAIGGFALDVLQDPTTYIGIGPVKRAATIAGKTVQNAPGGAMMRRLAMDSAKTDNAMDSLGRYTPATGEMKINPQRIKENWEGRSDWDTASRDFRRSRGYMADELGTIDEQIAELEKRGGESGLARVVREHEGGHAQTIDPADYRKRTAAYDLARDAATRFASGEDPADILRRTGFRSADDAIRSLDDYDAYRKGIEGDADRLAYSKIRYPGFEQAPDPVKFKVAGIPVGPNLRPLGDAIGTASRTLPGVRQATDAFGEVFNARHIASSDAEGLITGGRRADIGEAQAVVREGLHQRDAVQRRTLREALEEYKTIGATGADTPRLAAEASSTIEGLPPMSGTQKLEAERRAYEADRAVVGDREATRKLRAGEYRTDLHKSSDMVIDDINASTASAPAKAIAVKATEQMNRDLQRLLDAGIAPQEIIDNYVPHLYNDDPKFARTKLEIWRRSVTMGGGTPGFLRGRVIPTIEEAKRMGLHPIEDLRVLSSVHRAATEGALVVNKVANELKALGDNVVTKEVKPGWLPIQYIPALKDYYAHPEVAKMLTNLAPMMNATPAGLKLIGTIMGTATSYFKKIALATGGFHIRNAVGNAWLLAADGIVNPARYEQSAALLLGKLPHVELNGILVSRDDIIRWFEDAGLPGQGQFHETAGAQRLATMATQRTRNLDQPWMSRARDAVEVKKGHLGIIDTALSGSRKLGEETDSFFRMTAFLHWLDNGLDPTVAAEKVRKALFDYSELTPAERAIRSYAVPFYPWLRKNMARQMELLVTNPKMFTGTEHLRQESANAVGGDEQNLPPYMRETGAIQLMDMGQGNTLYATPNLPMYDLRQIHDPKDLRAWTKQWLEVSMPYLTIPAQIAANKTFMNDRTITDTPTQYDQAIKDYLEFFAGAVGGGIGRSFAAEQFDAEREARINAKADKGIATDVPLERPDAPGGKWLPFNVQNDKANARSAQLRELTNLQERQKVYELGGEALPTMDEIQREKNKGRTLRDALRDSAAQPQQSIVQSGAPAGGTRTLRDALRGAGQPVNVGPEPAVLSQARTTASRIDPRIDNSWAPYLTLLMMKESGGNPLRDNSTGPNGQPEYVETAPGRWEYARGLFQMMPSTFAQYAKKAGIKNPDIYNAEHNAIASMLYIAANYGHPKNIPGIGDSRQFKGY